MGATMRSFFGNLPHFSSHIFLYDTSVCTCTRRERSDAQSSSQQQVLLRIYPPRLSTIAERGNSF